MRVAFLVVSLFVLTCDAGVAQTAGPACDPSYPKPPTSAQTDTYFGATVADPYRPLEAVDSPETKAWVEAENRYTRCTLDAFSATNAKIAAAYRKLLNYPKPGVPFREGSRTFFTYNSGLQTQAVLYVREAERGPARVFFDPNGLASDGSIQVTDYSFSTDGSLMAYATSKGGEDWRTWHVKVVATGRELGDSIAWSKYSTAAWDGDLGFYYEGYDAPKAENATFARVGIHKVWFHRLGTPQSADRLVFASSAHPERFVGIETTRDGRYAFLSEATADTTQYFWKPMHAPDSAFVGFTSYAPNVTYGVVGNDGSRVYLTTTNGAPRARIVTIDLADPRHVQRVLVPEASDVLDGVSLVGDRFFLGYLHDAHSVVKIASLTGKPLGELALPGIGSGGLPYARRQDRIAYAYYSSYAVPSTAYRIDTKTLRSTVYDRSKAPFDSNSYVTDLRFARSKDGTRVPMFVTHRRDMRYDGNTPTLMYGYGGFDLSESPHFSLPLALWLEMGGTFVDVVLRGGGEYGEAWHDAGKLEKKQNVFDDFAAAGAELVDERITSTRKLAIDGGSNGGLLVGAEVTQHPSAFAAAIAEHGVLDMLRYDRFTVGTAYVPEWGSARASATQYAYLRAYSPLQNVVAGTAYPPTLVTTADHDDRVFPAHSYKFVAALQAAQSSTAPILLRVQTDEGHFSGLTVDREIALYADLYGFLAHYLDFEPTFAAGAHGDV